MSPGSTSGRTGRPRSLAADDAILRAALDAIVEHGIHDASVDEIAARAHAGKDTIYRRWPHKEDLIRAALEHALDATLPIPDTGSLGGDLTGYLRSLDDLITSGPAAALLREMVAEAPHDPPVAARLAAFRQRHVRAIAAIVGRASGDPSGDVTSPLAGVLVDWACGRRLVHVTDRDPLVDGTADDPVGGSADVVAWLVRSSLLGEVRNEEVRPRD